MFLVYWFFSPLNPDPPDTPTLLIRAFPPHDDGDEATASDLPAEIEQVLSDWVDYLHLLSLVMCARSRRNTLMRNSLE